MKFISHRGNILGPCKEAENTPNQISKVIEQGYECEIDVWIKHTRNDILIYLGHDIPQFPIEKIFLERYKDKLWCHAKNLPALVWLLENDFNTFSHDKDDYVLTSKNIIWAYPGKPLSTRCVCVMPEWHVKNTIAQYTTNELSECYGICSDYIEEYKNLIDNAYQMESKES